MGEDHNTGVMRLLGEIQSDTAEIKGQVVELKSGVKELDQAVRGNGQPGLKTEVAVMKARGRITMAILAAIGVAVIGLIGKIAFEWIKHSTSP